MAEIKKLLDDAIETEINNLNSASDKDEKSEVIKNLAALHKLRIEEIKTETEIEEKSERRAMDKAAHRVYWGTIAQQPTEIGRLCVEAALAALEGNNLGTQYADASIVTPENVVSFKETRDANNEAVKPYIEAWDFEMK